ncbi:MAG TPA: hypothetical protein VF026_33835 [Ktedonobacteraceae bacterium]
MQQQQEYMLDNSSSQRQSHTFSRNQRVFRSLFWSLVWFLFPIPWTLAWILELWWHIPLFLSLPILFLGLAALIVGAVRYGWSPRPWEAAPRDEQREPGADQAEPSEVSGSDFSDPQPFHWENEQFQVPYPGQE